MGAGPSLGAGVVLTEGGAHTRRVMYVDRPPFWAHDGGGAARLSASVPASAVGAVSLQEGADGGPAIPLRSADRMVLLMEALVDFLEAVDGNLHHRSVEPDRRSPHAVLDSLPCRISEGGESEKECNICLSQFQGGDNVRILPCRHEFHATCIDKWLLEVQRTCPCCRFDICSTDPDAEPKTPEEEASERVLRADSARQNLVADLRRTAVAEAARAAATRNAMRDADVIAEPAQQGQAMSSDHRQSLASEQAQSRGRPTAGAAHSSVLSEHALGLDAGADDEAGVAFPPSPSSRPAGFGSRLCFRAQLPTLCAKSATACCLHPSRAPDHARPHTHTHTHTHTPARERMRI